MITIDKEFADFAKKGLVTYVTRFSKNIEEKRANEIAEEILQTVDWRNSALMHKGFSWIVKNYLKKQNII